MNIKLDTHAVRQLFPEGTEARAQLQQSVINNVVKEMVLKDSDNAVRKQVQAEINLLGARIPDVTQAVKAQLNSFFTKKGWEGFQTTVEFDAHVRKEAEREVQIAVGNVIQNLVKKATANIEQQVTLAVEASARRAHQVVVDQINHNFKEIMNKAIQAKINEAFPVGQ